MPINFTKNIKYDKCNLCGEKFVTPSKYKTCWTCYKKTPSEKIDVMYKKPELVGGEYARN